MEKERASWGGGRGGFKYSRDAPYAHASPLQHLCTGATEAVPRCCVAGNEATSSAIGVNAACVRVCVSC